jgi:hypothetical protein
VGFRKCTGCKRTWRDRGEFLGDPEIALVGYQVNFSYLEAGYFLFNHLRAACQTTLAMPVEQFTDLYEGPVFAERATGSKDCPGHCVRESRLDPCPTKCECAFVREILQVIQDWDKRRPR